MLKKVLTAIRAILTGFIQIFLQQVVSAPS